MRGGGQRVDSTVETVLFVAGPRGEEERVDGLAVEPVTEGETP